MEIANLKNNVIYLIVISVFSALLLLTGIWQLSFIPGIFAGYIYNGRARKSFFWGLIAVGLSWLAYILYFIVNERALILMDYIMAFVIGSKGFGFIGIILSILIGGLLGGFGGIMGYSIFEIKNPSEQSTENNSRENNEIDKVDYKVDENHKEK